MQNIYLYVNIGIVVIYIIAMAGAYKRGFLFEAVNLLLSLAAFAVSWYLAPVFAQKWTLVQAEYFSDYLLKAVTPYINTILWLLIILAVFKFCSLFIVPVLKKVSKIPLIGFVNQLFGLAVGALHASFWMFLLSMLLALPFVPNGNLIRKHTLLSPINEYANKAIYFLMENVNVGALNNEAKDLTKMFAKWLEGQDFRNE